MRQVEMIMGTPIIVEIRDEEATTELFNEVFDYFKYVDDKFSVYKDTSEITAINKKRIKEEDASEDMKLVFRLSEETKKLTNGYFDIVTKDGSIDPSGMVKGWAISNAANILKNRGVKNFFVEAGGDIQTFGKNAKNEKWCIGIQNPFNKKREVVKKVYLSGEAIATSGNYIRGSHIYNPKNRNEVLSDIVSLSVVGPDILEADKYATAVYAMGKNGIFFIEELSGFEGYSIDRNGIATETRGFNRYAVK